MLAHIAGIPVEEWFMPFSISAGAALVGMRAMFGSSQRPTARRTGRRVGRQARGERAAMLDENTR